jgi:hypothetical protein
VSISFKNVKLTKFIELRHSILNLISYLESEFVIGFSRQGKSAFAPEGSKESLQAKIQFEKWRVMLEKPLSDLVSRRTRLIPSCSHFKSGNSGHSLLWRHV